MAAASSMDEALAAWLRDGLDRIGEIAIIAVASGGEFLLCHHRDLDRAIGDPAALESHTLPEDARAIGQFDESGEYRPLKTAPGLRGGWIMRLADVHALRAALDFFYPAMVGSWFRYLEGNGRAVPLRETLDRQTGMYRFAKNIDDAAANEIAGRLCHSRNCLKKVLWPIDPATPLESLPPSERDPAASPCGLAEGAIPMLCFEACNFVVTAARTAARDALDAGSTPRSPA